MIQSLEIMQQANTYVDEVLDSNIIKSRDNAYL